MKIPTSLKHKPVIVSENYEQVDGRYAAGTSDAKGLSWDWPNGTTEGRSTFRPKSGDTQGRNGPDNRKSCRCIAFSTWPFLLQEACSISVKRHIEIRTCTIQRIR